MVDGRNVDKIEKSQYLRNHLTDRREICYGDALQRSLPVIGKIILLRFVVSNLTWVIGLWSALKNKIVHCTLCTVDH